MFDIEHLEVVHHSLLFDVDDDDDDNHFENLFDRYHIPSFQLPHNVLYYSI